MSAVPASRGRRLVAGALARVEAFLLEPVEAAPRSVGISLRPVVACVALAPACGTTTLARAVAVELARRDPAGAAVAASDAVVRSVGPAGAAARRLARAVGTGTGESVRATGRLCLVGGGEAAALTQAVRHMAPLVIDVAHGEPAGAAVSLADHVLLVASPGTEPALAAAVAASLSRIGPQPATVLTRAVDGDRDLERWEGSAAATVWRSPLGARLALAGRDGRGALGAGLTQIADLCAVARSEW